MLDEMATRPGRDTLVAACCAGFHYAVDVFSPRSLCAARDRHRDGARQGLGAYSRRFRSDPDTRAAIRLTLITALVVVPIKPGVGLPPAVDRQFEFKAKAS